MKLKCQWQKLVVARPNIDQGVLIADSNDMDTLMIDTAFANVNIAGQEEAEIVVVTSNVKDQNVSQLDMGIGNTKPSSVSLYQATAERLRNEISTDVEAAAKAGPGGDSSATNQDGQRHSIEGILQVFKVFEAISGLKISLEKSTLYMAGVSSTTMTEILERFPFESGSLPVRYLGLPLLTKKMTTNDYTPLIEKIRSKIRCWTARFLSFTGRLQLIASVIQSLTNFWISAFRLPKACIEEIDIISAAFLWSGPTLNSNKAKVAWKDVCKPKEEGGLGLRPISEANKVSSLKLLWRIQSATNSLWLNWVKKYLIRQGSIWSVTETSSLGSWIWKKLLKIRDIAASLSKVEAYNGISTSFWFDSWSPLGRIYDITGPRGCIDLGIQINSTLASVLETHRIRRHRIDYLTVIEEAITNQRQKGVLEGNDVILWKHNAHSYHPHFNSKKTWTLIREVYPTVHWHQSIWFPNNTPKYSFIAWLAIRNRLSMGDRMVNWNNGAQSSCSLCSEILESRDHLFFACQFSADVWHRLTHKLLGAHFATHWDTILGLLSDTNQPKLKWFLLRYVFQVVIYSIWQEKNNRRNGKPATQKSQIIKLIDKQVRNRISTIQTNGNSSLNKGMELWFATR